jgi:S-adenosylmethionine/arginine decarboxylase-like enzyme
VTTETDAALTAGQPARADRQIFGYHLRINMSGCDLDRIRDGAEVLSWVQRMVSPAGIDMTEYGDLWMEHFGPEPGKIGWTVFRPITESGIVAHLNDTGTGFIDIHSCRWFDPDKAIHITKTFFAPKKITHDFTERCAP